MSVSFESEEIEFGHANVSDLTLRIVKSIVVSPFQNLSTTIPVKQTNKSTNNNNFSFPFKKRKKLRSYVLDSSGWLVAVGAHIPLRLCPTSQ